ncbi:unknown [Methanobrevibacter smithii CAG:186]|uniref:Uncharacterized protein n=1 Tax=Methanobrevibacter smithii CAG:186 TaxID=1263088 RepID=R7PR05_METSM|nr:unknown [Methanobrevibacter smithii CAG:186]
MFFKVKVPLLTANNLTSLELLPLIICDAPSIVVSLLIIIPDDKELSAEESYL